MTTTFAVDIVSDVVCPWCYIGKRNFEAARKLFPDVQFELRWRPYQLDPTIPPGGVDRKAYLDRKFGGKTADIYKRVARAGEEAGIPFRFEDIAVSPNTIDAHRVLRWAAGLEAQTPGVQNTLAERLFRDYFVDGKDVGDHAVLIAAARDCGMDGDVVAQLLAGDADKGAVQAEIIEAQNIGVTGVPFFILDGLFALPGAQPPDVLARAIEKAMAKRAAAE